MPLYKIWGCELTFYEFNSVMHLHNMYCIPSRLICWPLKMSCFWQAAYDDWYTQSVRNVLIDTFNYKRMLTNLWISKL